MESEWDKERKFEIENVSPVYLITALCVVPFGVYFLLNFLSPLVHRITAMKVSAVSANKGIRHHLLKHTKIYVYPIKSLRAVKVNEALGTQYGFKHDRRSPFSNISNDYLTPTGTFLLMQITPDGPKPMAISRQPEMSQFFQEIEGYNDTDGSLRITFRAFGNASAKKSLTIPLTPDVSKLEPYEVTMHDSPTSAFKMPAKYNDWFTSCFGYDVMLVYLGTNTRPVLFEDMQPLEPDPLTRFLRDKLPFTKGYVERLMGLHQTKQWRISFADCAPYLITSQTSLENVSDRLPEGMDMDMEKFRPNIVIAGAWDAFQEDYWGKLKINNRTEIVMAHNCVRCSSINIDYETGKPAKGPMGEVLKKMQHDRRIDIGSKWAPVFGRYSFWGVGEKSEVIRVGDQVNVSKMNQGLTIWSKFVSFLLFLILDTDYSTDVYAQVGQACKHHRILRRPSTDNRSRKSDQTHKHPSLNPVKTPPHPNNTPHPSN
jgi:uncharacterized protein YcbX